MGGAMLGGSAFLIGGLSNSPDGGPQATDVVQKFDTSIRSWSRVPKLPVALHHEMAVAYDGTVLVIGGWVPDGANLTATASARVYALRSRRWVEGANMSLGRAEGAAAVVDDKVVVVGGKGGTNLVGPTEIFDGKRWKKGAPIPTAREHLGAASDGRYLYAVGGRNADGENLNTVERYDPRSDSWSRLPSMRTRRNGVGAVVVGDRLFAVGGQTSSEVLRNVEVYDIARRTWAVGPSLPEPRHGMVVLATNGAIYALGGALGVDHTESTRLVEELDVGKK